MTCFSELDETDSSDDVYASAKAIVNRINTTNGFTVTGWYKKGVANDHSNNEANESIAAGTITIHPVYIVLTNLDEDDEAFIDSNKFKGASMHISE